MNYLLPKPVLFAIATTVALPGALLAQAVPIGQGAHPIGENSVPVGENAVPIGQGAVPIGEGAHPIGENSVPVGEGAVPVGEGAVPVGEGAVPVGEGAVPVGENAHPIGKNSVPVGEGAVPVGEGAVPVGEDAVPVGEDAVPVGESAVPTNLATQKERYQNITSINTNPAMAHLVEGDDVARWQGSEGRLGAAIQNRSNLNQATEAQRQKENLTWGSNCRRRGRLRPAGVFRDNWWQENQSKLESPAPYPKTKPSDTWLGKSSWDQLSQTTGITENPFEYRYDSNVVFHKDVIYVNGVAIATHSDFVSAAKRLAADESVQPNSKWTPIGTFILSTSPNSKTDPQVVQLAVDQFGNIAGVYFHWSSGAVHNVKGKVDKTTQRVAFTIGTNQDITIETGLANLADDEVRLWAHLPNHVSQTWLLARIDS